MLSFKYCFFFILFFEWHRQNEDISKLSKYIYNTNINQFSIFSVFPLLIPIFSLSFNLKGFWYTTCIFSISNSYFVECTLKSLSLQALSPAGCAGHCEESHTLLGQGEGDSSISYKLFILENTQSCWNTQSSWKLNSKATQTIPRVPCTCVSLFEREMFLIHISANINRRIKFFQAKYVKS